VSRFRLVRPRNLVPVLLAVSLSLAGAAGAAPPSTESGKKAARPHYEKGAAEYNLGHFSESIAEFEKAYELDPAPILLFNIAQAHSQNGSNERAALFYRRYLEQAPNAANRPEVEKRIKDLEEMMKQQNDVKRRPPTEVTDQQQEAARTDPTRASVQTTTPPPMTTPSVVTGSATPPAAAPAATPAATPQPEGTVAGGPGATADDLGRRIRLRASGGLALPRFGGLEGSQPAQFSMRVGGEYTFDLGGPGYLDVGLGLSFVPFSYTRLDTGANVGSSFWGVMAAGVYRYRLTRELELSGEIGIGVIWLTGVGEESPFVKPDAGGTVPGTSGALAMPSVSLGVAAIYRLPYRIFVYGQPGFTFSKTATDGLTISSVSRFDFALGVGYAL